MANHNSTSTNNGAWNAGYVTPKGRPTNANDAKIAQHVMDADGIRAGQDTAQVTATQDGKTRRNDATEKGLTERQRLTQRGRAITAGAVAAGAALTAGLIGVTAPGIINAANAPTVAASQANADAAKAEAGVKTITVETGGETKACVPIFAQVDADGKLEIVKMPGTDDNGSRVTGDQVGDYIDGAGRVVVKDGRSTNTVYYTVDVKTGKVIGPVPDGCGIDGPKG